ncbi:unnamed protein product [Lactuca virosa]|uniref:SHSP domain-containing protein n=1 Tax=Lactuca virosa TaxID=75947 RepID=A0AAU9MDM4_9ASTR|nr:unnamed protein product [Lactuca virosa]
MAMSRFITHSHRSPLKTQQWTSQFLHRFTITTSTDHPEKSDTKELSISESTTKPKLFSPKRRSRRSRPWSRNNDRNVLPSLSGVGHAIVEAAANMNRLLENLSLSHLIRRFKEKDESYSIKYQMPGLSKDDVKITVEDGMLFIRGEHKEEEEEGDEEEYWTAARYGYYNTSLMLPEDAKVEEIKAEMKDGVLHVIIPKDDTKKKNVKEVKVG